MFISVVPGNINVHIFLAVIVRRCSLYLNKIPKNLNSSLPRAVVIFKTHFQNDPDIIGCIAPRMYGKSGKSKMI